MQVIGFSFKKIEAERSLILKKGSSINTNIEILEIQKQKVESLASLETLEINYLFSINYQDNEKKEEKDANQEIQGKIIFNGSMLLSVSKDETKDILKSWKKKEIPPTIKVFLSNIIMRKCTPKALELEDELGLPSHIPIPQIRLKQQDQ